MCVKKDLIKLVEDFSKIAVLYNSLNFHMDFFRKNFPSLYKDFKEERTLKHQEKEYEITMVIKPGEIVQISIDEKVKPAEIDWSKYKPITIEKVVWKSSFKDKMDQKAWASFFKNNNQNPEQ